MQDPQTVRSSAPEHAERGTGRAAGDATGVLAEASWDRSDLVGRRLGRYTVLERLGAGGMGEVYAAYDPSLDRKVAVKVLRSERAGEDDSSRLWREAQALARLSHPNVVKVHEVGRSEDGAVFVAMEFVRGASLRAWQRTGPGVREVLAAYVQAGRGLGAAHEAGLVHQDFKPDNVMRTEDGGVKVLDFGLARASEAASEDTVTGGPSSPSTSLTLAGTVVGTPHYMSPEQHEGREVDARSDQYGYCVALWEGLTGERPFAGEELELLYAAKLEGPPPWPAGAPALPRSLVDALRRGMAVEPERRWRSMDALLEALRWEPERRRRGVRMGVGGLVVAGLGAAGLGAAGVVGYVRAQAERCSGARAKLEGVWDETRRVAARVAVLGVERPYAAEVWERTEQSLDEYAEAWVAMHTEACEATAVRHEQSARRLDLRMGCLHRAAVELGATVDTLTEADPKVVDNAHELVVGLRPLSRCANAQALEAEVEPPLPREIDAVERAREQLARARSEYVAGRYEAALQAVEAAKAVLVAMEYGPVHAERALEEGDVLEKLGRYDAAVDAYGEALERAVRWPLREQAARAATKMMTVVGVQLQRIEDALEIWPVARGLSWSDPLGMADARGSLGSILMRQGKYAESEAEQRLALAAREEALGPDHPRVAMARNNLANILRAQGKYEEAEAELRLSLAAKERALGPAHPRVAASRINLAAILQSKGEYEAAEAELRLALALLETALGSDHPDVATSRSNLGGVLHARGKHEEAEAEFRRALALLEKAMGPDHPLVAMSRNNLAVVLEAQGKYEEAEAEHRSALIVRERSLGAGHPEVATSRNNLANVLEAQGRYEEAEVEHRRALALLEEALGPDHPEVAASRLNLGHVLGAQGRHEDAEAEYRRALALFEEALEPDHPDVAVGRTSLAALLLARGRQAEALPLAEQAWQRLQRDDVAPGKRATTAFVLARLLWSVEEPQRDRARARSLAEAAASGYRASEGDVTEDLAKVEQWQSTHRLP